MKLKIELEVDMSDWAPLDEEEREFLLDQIKEDPELILHSNDIGDQVGLCTVKKARIEGK